MLTKRVIPCLDVKDGRVVKGKSFESLRDSGDPVELARRYYEEGADELVFLDITASKEHRDTMIGVVERVADVVFMPLTVGGGLRSVDDMRRLLLSGADKVSVNTAAVRDPALVSRAADRFGSQCVVVAIDAKRVPRSNPLRWQVHTYGGSTPVEVDALQWAVKAAALGAGEILLTSMDADGHRLGYDIELTREVSTHVTIPVIASGGAGSLHDLLRALDEGQADAVLAASIFHYNEISILETKRYLANHGVAVRL
ncbi:MAG: imidazole glycerol phosphate synthase subunit HisF [Dehalococcoidia bacterium]|nr:MAG: imidazole glycerol phosphate synthase subunit HisF [Dehalococcoidia bacterium]